MGVGSFFTSKLDEAIGWARKYSIFQYARIMMWTASARGFLGFLLVKPMFSSSWGPFLTKWLLS